MPTLPDVNPADLVVARMNHRHERIRNMLLGSGGVAIGGGGGVLDDGDLPGNGGILDGGVDGGVDGSGVVGGGGFIYPIQPGNIYYTPGNRGNVWPVFPCVVRVSGSIIWSFSGVNINVVPSADDSMGNAYTLTASWNQTSGGGFIPLAAYSDIDWTVLEHAWNQSLPTTVGGETTQTWSTSSRKIWVVQTGTNYAGNYTSEGSTGVIEITFCEGDA